MLKRWRRQRIVIIDVGATHSFISLSCAERLEHMDVIFRMYLLLSFGVNINCLTKSETFSKLKDRVKEKFLTTRQVDKSFDSEACLFMMFSSLKGKLEKEVGDLRVLNEFPDVFLDDITDLSPKKSGFCY